MNKREREEALLKQLEETFAYKRTHKLQFWKPYPKQLKFLSSKTRETLFMAGNQVGKSDTGAMLTALHLTGLYPDWYNGKRFEHPTRGWAAGIKGLDVRNIQQKKLCGTPGVIADFGTGLIPKDCFVDKPSLSRGVTDAYDTIQVQHHTNGVKDGVSTLQFKSYEQGRVGFQGDTIDFGWADEEPEKIEVYSEFLTRLAAGGLLFTTFTPLFGKTELTMRFTDKHDPDRSIYTMTLEDAEHFDADEKRKRLAGYRRHERDARAKGVPLLGSGRIFLTDEDTIGEAHIEHIPRHWVKLWGIDFGIGHPFAAVLILWDKDNDVIHVHHCIRMNSEELGGGLLLNLPMHHAKAMMPIGGEVPVAWPQDGTAREKSSGKPLAHLYREQGLKMLSGHATWAEGGISTEAGILEMEERFSSGRLKVAKHLSDWWDEYRTYHRKEGEIVKVRDDLMSATRVAIMDKRHARIVELGSRRIEKRRMLGPDGNICEGVDTDDPCGLFS